AEVVAAAGTGSAVQASRVATGRTSVDRSGRFERGRGLERPERPGFSSATSSPRATSVSSGTAFNDSHHHHHHHHTPPFPESAIRPKDASSVAVANSCSDAGAQSLTAALAVLHAWGTDPWVDRAVEAALLATRHLRLRSSRDSRSACELRSAPIAAASKAAAVAAAGPVDE
ncbi:hypothetical protein Agub_g15834, partial [Astrephomene gubernaculifera]